MPTRRVIQGALQNFLGTFTSRYSDYDGYWLFGMFVDELHGLHIDLLVESASTVGSEPVAVATTLARTKFREQIQKAGLAPTFVREAHLTVTRSAMPAGDRHGLYPVGYDFTFVASAVSDRGTQFEAYTTAFVAPHNPALGGRSGRRT